MVVLRFIGEYFAWHYSEALVDVVHIWKNILHFLYEFFSISLLLRTLFTPWKRLGEERRRKFDLGDIIGVLIINTIMRIIGTVMRFVLIVFGSVAIALCLLGGVLALFVWVFAPLIIAVLLIVGFGIMFLES